MTRGAARQLNDVPAKRWNLNRPQKDLTRELHRPVEAAIKNLGGEIKDIYLTTGQYDLLVIVDAPDGDAMAKFTLAVGQQGNVRSTTVRGFTEDEFYSILADLP